MENHPGSSTSGVYNLKWKGYGVHLTNRISNLLQEEQFADVTLACDGNYIRAHKLLLSLCSPYFKKLFEIHSPEKSNTIVILNHVRFSDLENILNFVYTGQVHVHQTDLNSFLQTGELLQIEGLANSPDNTSGKSTSNPTSDETEGFLASEFCTTQGSDTSNVRSESVALNRSAHTSYACDSPALVINPNTSSSSGSSTKRCKSSSNQDSQSHSYFSSQDQPQLRQPQLTQHISGNNQRNSMNDLVELCSPSQNIEKDPLAETNSETIIAYGTVGQKHSHGEEKELGETEVDLGILKTENIVIDIKDSEDESTKDNQSLGLNEEHQGFLSNLIDHTRDVEQERVGFEFYTESSAVESPIATTSSSLAVVASPSSSAFEVTKCRFANNRVMDSSLVEGNNSERGEALRINSCLLSPEKLDGEESQSYSTGMDSKLETGRVKIEEMEEDSEVEEVEVLQLGPKPLLTPDLKANSLSGYGFGGVRLTRRLNSEHIFRQNPHPYSMSVTPVSSRSNLVASLGVGIRMVGPAQVHIEFVRCTVCNEEVAKYALREHVLKTHCNEKESEMRALCPICGKYFKNKNSLKVHKSMYHRNRGFKPLSSSLSSEDSQFPSMSFSKCDNDQHY